MYTSCGPFLSTHTVTRPWWSWSSRILERMAAMVYAWFALSNLPLSLFRSAYYQWQWRLRRRGRKRDRRVDAFLVCGCDTLNVWILWLCESEVETSPLLDVSEVELIYMYIEALGALPNGIVSPSVCFSYYLFFAHLLIGRLMCLQFQFSTFELNVSTRKKRL
jgi:hypothetical protein